MREYAPTVSELVAKKSYVDYAIYAKFKGKIRMA
jgi:hydroxymethylglutaryl-CoA synthase